MVSMIDIDEFLPEVLPYAPGTSDLIAYRYIASAARDICERAKVWRADDEFEITTPGQQGLLTIPDAEIVKIEDAALDGVDLEPVTAAWLDTNFRGWSRQADLSNARYVTQTAWNTISIYPRQEGSFSGRFVLKPSRRATQLPEFMLNEFAEDIGKGAASKILTLNTQEAVPQLGLDLRSWFESRLDELSTKAAKGQQNARLRTKGAYL